MKTKTWTNNELVAVGTEMVSSGVTLVWSKMKVDPTALINVDGGQVNSVEFFMNALLQAKTPVTNARKLTEDIVSMALSSGHPHTEWVKSLMVQANALRCSQGWVEKQVRRLIDASDGDSVALILDWSKYVQNLDQKIAMSKVEAYYLTQKGKESRRISSKQYQEGLVDVPGGLFGSGFGWNLMSK